MVKKEERNLCFTHDEDEEKDDDVSVYCVQAQGSLVCLAAACGRDTATPCSTYYTICVLYLWHRDTATLCSSDYTICVLIYDTGTLQHGVLFFYAGTVVSNTMC